MSILLLSTSIASQERLIPNWVKTDISSKGVSEAWGIAHDNQGNVFWSVSNDNRNQGLDVVAYKYDENGNALWDAPFIYGGPGTQHAYINRYYDGNLFIGGRLCSGLINTCDMMLVKVDATEGTLVWDRSLNFPADGYDELDGLEFEGDIIHTGGWSQAINPDPFQSDIGLWTLDQDGNTLWTNHLGEENTAEHQDGHFAIDENYIYAAGLWGGTSVLNLYNGYSFLGKFSKEDGALIDSTLFGHQSDVFLDIENALGMTSDGTHLYITGYSTPLEFDEWQLFVAKYDKDLNQIWFTDWGGTGTESARGIQVQDGVVYIGGLTESPELTGGNKRDGLLVTFDVDGNFLSYGVWGGEKSDSFHDISVDGNMIYLTGETQDEATPLLKESFLIAIENIISSNEKITVAEDEFNIFPNPSHGDFYFNNKSPYTFDKIVVYDATGRAIVQGNYNDSSRTSSLAPGTYFVEAINENFKVTRKLIVH